MQRNLLSLLVASLFTPMLAGALPEGGGNTEERAEKSLVKIPEKIVSWHDQGKKEGKRVVDAEGKADMLAIQLYLVYGAKLGGHEGAGDWLEGYASAWTNPNTKKVRKSEAKAVFDAFGMGAETRELLLGYESGDTNKPIKQTKTIKEWLEGHDKMTGYAGKSGLLLLAKRLRGTAAAPVNTGSGAGAPGSATVKAPRLTDKQYKDFIDRLPAATSGMAGDLVERATAKIAAMPNGHLALFREINMVANRIKTMIPADHAQADLILGAAGQIGDVCESVLAKVISTVNTVHAAPPAPAQAQVPQGEAKTPEQMIAANAAQKTGTAG